MGGRIGHATHLLGSMLDLKPVLALVQGEVESVNRFRTRRRALAALAEMVKEQIAGKAGVQLAIIHALCESDAHALADDLCAAVTPDEFLFGEVGPAVGTHAGPGTLGVCWYAPE
jgi:DegV family protein with EDD domain